MKTEMIDHNKYSDSILSISRFFLIQQRFHFSLSLTCFSLFIVDTGNVS